jgi:DNA-binding MarR family transcriptional regulator
MKLTILAAQIRAFSEYLQGVGAELFIEAYRTYGVKGLSIQQLRYLEIIEGKRGVTPGDLALGFGVKKPTVTRIVKDLERLGLIRRERSGDDKRVSNLYPTGRAIGIFSKRRGMYLKLASHVSARLSGAELRTLSSLFGKIAIERSDHE